LFRQRLCDNLSAAVKAGNKSPSAPQPVSVILFEGARGMSKGVSAEQVLVCIRRQWNGKDRAFVLLEDILDPHWSRISGGVRAVSPFPMISGYISCEIPSSQLFNF
jgi:hypothetical protein